MWTVDTCSKNTVVNCELQLKYIIYWPWPIGFYMTRWESDSSKSTSIKFNIHKIWLNFYLLKKKNLYYTPQTFNHFVKYYSNFSKLGVGLPSIFKTFIPIFLFFSHPIFLSISFSLCARPTVLKSYRSLIDLSYSSARPTCIKTKWATIVR